MSAQRYFVFPVTGSRFRMTEAPSTVHMKIEDTVASIVYRMPGASSLA